MQSVGIEELHESRGRPDRGHRTPPGMGAIPAPGYGTHLLGRLDRAPNRAMIGAMIADEPSGRVFGSRAPLVAYRLAKADERRLATAIRAMARVMLAAGAKDVELGGGAPAVRSESELEAAMQRLDVRRLRLAGFHPSGTAAAGSDPARHPVDPEGRLRGVDGVWVADGSVLPSCPGVNPQVSIMAIAAGVGRLRLRRGRANPGPTLPLNLTPALCGRAAYDVVPLVQHPLQLGYRLGRMRGDLAGQLQRRLLGGRRRGDADDHAEPQRLVGADRARGEEQVLRGGEAAERDQAGWADPYAERGSREAQAQVGATDAHVAGDGDLGTAADHVAVDRRQSSAWGRRRSRRIDRRRAACGGYDPHRRAPP